jgi:hypothetical protein
MFKRRRFKQTKSLRDRLSKFLADARGKVSSLPPGRERAKLLENLEQTEIAVQIDAWANSARLQRPKR